jgi:hypothetical protein
MGQGRQGAQAEGAGRNVDDPLEDVTMPPAPKFNPTSFNFGLNVRKPKKAAKGKTPKGGKKGGRTFGS